MQFASAVFSFVAYVALRQFSTISHKRQAYRKKKLLNTKVFNVPVTVHREQSVKREKKPTRCNNQMFIINFCLNVFRASLCPSSGEQRPGYFIWCTALVLLDVVGSGCVVFVLLKMGIMMPETC